MSIGVLLLVLAAAGQPPAVGTFSVASADGQAVSAAAVFAGERKVVVYVAPAIAPAAPLLETLRKAYDNAGAFRERWDSRLVVIVASPPAEARRWLERSWGDGDLPTWYADPDAAGWRALRFDGTMGVVGTSNGNVEWKLDGVINDPAVLEPAVRAWIEGSAQ